MRKFLMLLVMPAIALSIVLFQADDAAAAGTGIMSGGKITPDVANPMVQKVHGCHRGVVRGPWTGIWHRHAGEFCIWTPKQNPCKKWRNRCRKRCYNRGVYNIKKCTRRCYRRNAPRRCFG